MFKNPWIVLGCISVVFSIIITVKSENIFYINLYWKSIVLSIKIIKFRFYKNYIHVLVDGVNI